MSSQRRFLNRTIATLYLVSGLLSFEVHGQITVDQSLTIQEYVNDILLGEGVTATNIPSWLMERFGYMTGGLDEGFPIEGGLVSVLEMQQMRFVQIKMCQLHRLRPTMPTCLTLLTVCLI